MPSSRRLPSLSRQRASASRQRRVVGTGAGERPRRALYFLRALPATNGPLHAFVRRDGAATMEAVATALLASQPELTDAAPTARAALGDALLSHVTLLDEFLGLPGRAPARLLPPAERWARTLADEGCEPVALVRAYQLGHAEVWHHFVRSIRTGRRALPAAARSQALESATASIFRYMHAVTALAVAAYTDAQGRRARRSGWRRTELVEGLLAGTIDEALFENVLGYRLGEAHVAYVMWIDPHPDGGGEVALEEAADALCEALRPAQHVGSPAGERALQGWFRPSPGWERIARVHRWPAGLHLACGTSHRGRDGFRLSHREALEARRVAERLPGSAGFVSYQDVAATALASRDSELARTFVERELGPLASDPCLLMTLQVLLAELGSPTHAARALGLHPNTLIKRLARIEALLGRPVDPSSLSLRLALSLLPLTGQRSS